MITDEQQSLLEQYLREVLQKNEELNLTTITSFEAARMLHLEDSLLALPEVLAAPEGVLVDLGSGGGFPGVPLAVATRRETTLVDSRKKKMDAIAAILEACGINGVQTCAMRVEELALDQPEQYAVATARALSTLPVLLELAAPLLLRGGKLIAYKGPECADEIDAAAQLESKLGMRQTSIRRACLSDGATERTIVVYEKYASPQVKLPRRPGVAQKRPYA
ncbi:MAG: 16S rRNA (guanine(527)-N(7))-methyltransferase RsmG [Eggerthellaceae bacterium]|nr:16S rRNA (guanine(527)-N(7))-methyltransferase RsmG [Eggerthellaceae bacterium]